MLVSRARSLGTQARTFSRTAVNHWDPKDTWMKQCPNLTPWYSHYQQQKDAESRFRLTGDPWSQVLIHKGHGLAKTYRYSTFEYRAKARWRTLHPKFQKKYRRYVLPQGVQETRWSPVNYSSNESLC
eukprot:TRINITY_DN19756_c0_g1_i1.p1 TRINITY_DN19756_c0_g1~~TRINITY_DN19756_c0_g1_i1.p1  ORF type:complete len:140 (+),score=5.62 TRINITY_DN19756_c0_g1_i1:42-422(+)